MTITTRGAVAESGDEETSLHRYRPRKKDRRCRFLPAMGEGDDREAGPHPAQRGFLFALSQREKLPSALLFYNGGAHVTCEGSPSLEDLKNLAALGVGNPDLQHLPEPLRPDRPASGSAALPTCTLSPKSRCRPIWSFVRDAAQTAGARDRVSSTERALPQRRCLRTAACGRTVDPHPSQVSAGCLVSHGRRRSTKSRCRLLAAPGAEQAVATKQTPGRPNVRLTKGTVHDPITWIMRRQRCTKPPEVAGGEKRDTDRRECRTGRARRVAVVRRAWWLEARSRLAELFGCRRADHVVFHGKLDRALNIAVYGLWFRRAITSFQTDLGVRAAPAGR
ncbi:MAG: hypothetical protein ACLR4Z_13750 [Butyricicoccaceae bacterium]